MDNLQAALGELIPDHDEDQTKAQPTGRCYRCAGVLAPGLATCPNCGARNAVIQMDSAEAKRLVQPPASTGPSKLAFRGRDEVDEINHSVHRSIFLDILSTVTEVILWVVLLRWVRDRDG